MKILGIDPGMAIVGYSILEADKDNLKLYAGSSANPTAEIALASSDETGSVYDLSAGDYSYIKIENPSNYAVYMKSIDIYLAK